MTIRVWFPGNGFQNRADLIFSPCPFALAMRAVAVMYPHATKVEVME